MQHSGPKGLVAAFNQGHPKAYFRQNQGQRAAALAATPAVGQWHPFSGFVNDFPVNVRGDVARRQGCTAFFGFERIDLLVQGANVAALVVVERGPVHGVGQMVLVVLALAAGVNHGVKGVQALQHLGGGQGGQAHFRIFFSSGHTLASMMGWASSLG